MIIDASVLLSAYFPDEFQPQAQYLIREHISNRLVLRAPSLLIYEVNNAVWQAERRRRITGNQADSIVSSMSSLNIEIEKLDWDSSILPVARKFNISGYDSAYLNLAFDLSEPLVTGDGRFYQAAKVDIASMLWIGDINIESK